MRFCSNHRGANLVSALRWYSIDKFFTGNDEYYNEHLLGRKTRKLRTVKLLGVQWESDLSLNL
jgi:hypothetical protein